MAKKEQNPEKEKPAFEERQPILSRKITLSRDNQWLIIKTIRTDIVHINYIDKVLGESK